MVVAALVAFASAIAMGASTFAIVVAFASMGEKILECRPSVAAEDVMQTSFVAEGHLGATGVA